MGTSKQPDNTLQQLFQHVREHGNRAEREVALLVSDHYVAVAVKCAEGEKSDDPHIRSEWISARGVAVDALKATLSAMISDITMRQRHRTDITGVTNECTEG